MGKILVQSGIIIGLFSCIGLIQGYIISQRSFRQNDEIQCPDKNSTGQYNHPKYCDMFINCWMGEPTLGKCGAWLVFNQNASGCDYPRNVDCGTRGLSESPQEIDPRCKEPFGTYPNPKNSSQYFECQSGVATVFSCPGESKYNPSLGVCDQNEAPELANEEGDAARVTLYEDVGHRGASLKMKLDWGQCKKVPGWFNDRASSVNTHGTCIYACEHEHCRGHCERIAPGTQCHSNLDECGLHDQISSIKPC